MASKEPVDHLGVAFGHLDAALQAVDLDNIEETIAAGGLMFGALSPLMLALFAHAKLGMPGHKLLLKEGEESMRRSLEAALTDFETLCACVMSKECRHVHRGLHKSKRRRR
jgi:hypothetical protein